MREDRDLRTYTRRGALGLMGAGGVFAATETFGFTDATRNRGLNINTSNDLNAILKIAAQTDNGDTPLNEDSAQPFHPSLAVEITNNAAEQVTLTTVSSSNSVTNDLSSDQTLLSGETVPIVFENTTRKRRDSDITIEADISTELSIKRSAITFRAADSLDTSISPSNPTNGDNIDITATVEDTDGEPIKELEVEFSVDSGSGEFSTGNKNVKKPTDADGKANITYEPGNEDDNSSVTISSNLLINDLSHRISASFRS